jgi:hypothetical protein
VKFKVGDVVQTKGGGFIIATIKKVDANDTEYPYLCVDDIIGSWWVAEDDIEKVEAEH